MAILVARTNLPVWDFQKLASLMQSQQVACPPGFATHQNLLLVLSHGSGESLCVGPLQGQGGESREQYMWFVLGSTQDKSGDCGQSLAGHWPGRGWRCDDLTPLPHDCRSHLSAETS